MRKISQMILSDELLYRAFTVAMTLILLVPVWSNSFLPMQDYPQHLFMAWVGSTYGDPGMGWQAYFELRNPLGPYRASFLLQKSLLALTDPFTAGKVLVTLYILLVALLVSRLRLLAGSGAISWSGLILLPLALHPMFFFGFVNFTFSIPVLVFALIDLKKLIESDNTATAALRHLALLLLLFLMHPYTVLVYILLASASAALLCRGRTQVMRAAIPVSVALGLFFGWMLLSATAGQVPGVLDIAGAQVKWWPLEWKLSFLAMMFTGMNISQDPDLLVAGLWLALLAVALTGQGRKRGNWRYRLWLPLLCAMLLGGYFLLPFSVTSGARFTFFSTRLAPILFFLLAAGLAQFPPGKVLGRLLAVICLVLTVFSARLYDRVAAEVDSITPLFDKMDTGAAVLPLIGRSPSAHLDPLFYYHFHYSDVLYYHIIRGGGINPDIFNNRLMPVVLRPGVNPGRPPQRELQLWPEYADDYDYIIARQVPGGVYRQLQQHAEFVMTSGPWTLFSVRK